MGRYLLNRKLFRLQWLVMLIGLCMFLMRLSLNDPANKQGYIRVSERSQENEPTVSNRSQKGRPFNTSTFGITVSMEEGKVKAITSKPVPGVGKKGDVPWINKTDIHDYHYVIQPKRHKCAIESGTNSHRNLTLLILIKSSPNNTKLRDTVRRTYIRGAMTYKTSAEMVFLLGMPKESEKQKNIIAEAETHGDILQEGFVDSYYNLSTKLIMGFKWASTFCSNSDFVMSIDDDVMVDVVTLTSDLSGFSSKCRKECVIAHRLPKSVPRRRKDSKWYVPKEVYPERFYPPYPEGQAYIVSKDISRKLYLASLETPPFPFDDVYAGMLFKKLNVTMTGRYPFYTYRHKKVEVENYPQGDYVKWNLSVEKMETVWNAIETYLNKTEVK